MKRVQALRPCPCGVTLIHAKGLCLACYQREGRERRARGEKASPWNDMSLSQKKAPLPLAPLESDPMREIQLQILAELA